jgi:SAM-dependent methyltransferase
MPESGFVCRACGGAEVVTLLEMGALPLANAFVKAESDTDDLFREQLTLVMCRACSLPQLREEVPPEQLFRSYLWVTSTSAGAARHAVWLAQRLADRYGAPGRPFLVELASNDGFFLEHYRKAGFDILGIDPSDLALEADARGLPSIREFFSEAVARRVRTTHRAADVIVARNVLGHTNRPADFIAGVKHLLAPGGHFVLEVPYALMLRDETQYDTIFHEHVSYPTITAVANLLRAVGLKIVDISFVQMNGGSMLCDITHADSPQPANVQAFLDLEALTGLNTPEGWQRFAGAVVRQRRELRELLDGLKAKGSTIVGYGAAAKSMTMLNYCGIGRQYLDAMGDANPRKQGLLCPGVRVPVVSPEAVMALDPDYILIGAWNFRNEIIGQFRARGYRKAFIVPLPVPEVVEA